MRLGKTPALPHRILLRDTIAAFPNRFKRAWSYTTRNDTVTEYRFVRLDPADKSRMTKIDLSAKIGATAEVPVDR